MAASSIANIVKSSLGPVGLDKMLVDDVGVSKDCNLLFYFYFNSMFMFLCFFLNHFVNEGALAKLMNCIVIGFQTAVINQRKKNLWVVHSINPVEQS